MMFCSIKIDAKLFISFIKIHLSVNPREVVKRYPEFGSRYLNHVQSSYKGEIFFMEVIGKLL